MNSLEFKNLIKNIVGLRLTQILLFCEMISLSFEKYAIHAQCFTRIIKNKDILLTTLDYQSWDGETDTNNDEWYNLNIYKSIIENGVVTSIELTPFNDLTIELDNGIIIQILIQNGYAHFNDESEQYRFFEYGNDDETDEQASQRKHYVVYNKHIEVN